MGKPCPASKKHLFEKSANGSAISVTRDEEKDHGGSDDGSSSGSSIFEVITPSQKTKPRRSSDRPSKPVAKKAKYTEENSEEEVSEDGKSEEDSDFEDSQVSSRRGGAGRGKGGGRGRGRGGGRTPAKKPAAAKKPPARKSTGGSYPRKMSKKADTDEEASDDENYEDMEEDEEESGSEGEGSGKKTKGKAKKSKSAASDNYDAKNDDDDVVDYESLKLDDDNEVDEFKDWKAPNYTDKAWFKKNCLFCQICKKTFGTTGEALKCFHRHKDRLRCYICFWVIKGGKNGTKRLYRHYQRHHEKGDKPNSNRCPHCNESFPYKSTSCHIISAHFRPALGLPEKPAESSKDKGSSSKGKQGAKVTLKNKKKKRSDESDDSMEISEDEDIKAEPESEEEEEYSD